MDKFDEYKFFTERVQQRSERRQKTTQIYLTVNTAIIGVIALLIKDSGLQGWNLASAMLPLFAIGILVCTIWRTIILNFKKVIGWHYEQLREMEETIEGSHKIHTKEYDKFFKPKSDKEEGFSFSDLEAWMPSIFIGIYVIYGIGVVIAVLNGLL